LLNSRIVFFYLVRLQTATDEQRQQQIRATCCHSSVWLACDATMPYPPGFGRTIFKIKDGGCEKLQCCLRAIFRARQCGRLLLATWCEARRPSGDQQLAETTARVRILIWTLIVFLVSNLLSRISIFFVCLNGRSLFATFLFSNITKTQ
jgi:hypothetical protein